MRAAPEGQLTQADARGREGVLRGKTRLLARRLQVQGGLSQVHGASVTRSHDFPARVVREWQASTSTGTGLSRVPRQLRGGVAFGAVGVAGKRDEGVANILRGHNTSILEPGGNGKAECAAAGYWAVDEGSGIDAAERGVRGMRVQKGGGIDFEQGGVVAGVGVEENLRSAELCRGRGRRRFFQVLS